MLVGPFSFIATHNLTMNAYGKCGKHGIYFWRSVMTPGKGFRVPAEMARFSRTLPVVIYVHLCGNGTVRKLANIPSMGFPISLGSSATVNRTLVTTSPGKWQPSERTRADPTE